MSVSGILTEVDKKVKKNYNVVMYKTARDM